MIMIPFMYMLASVVPLLVYFYLSEKRKVCFRDLLIYLAGLACTPAFFAAGFIAYETSFLMGIFVFIFIISIL